MSSFPILNLMLFSFNVVCYPTDTSFGLGAPCTNETLIRRLFTLKKRDTAKPVSLMVRDWEMLKKYAKIPPELTEDWFSEMPRTALLKPQRTLPKSFAWPTEKVGFRLCLDPQVQAHITEPITATSANIAGEPDLYTLAKAKANYGNAIAYLEHKPTLEQKKPSQIVDWTTSPPVIIRA